MQIREFCPLSGRVRVRAARLTHRPATREGSGPLQRQDSCPLRCPLICPRDWPDSTALLRDRRPPEPIARAHLQAFCATHGQPARQQNTAGWNCKTSIIGSTPIAASSKSPSTAPFPIAHGDTRLPKCRHSADTTDQHRRVRPSTRRHGSCRRRMPRYDQPAVLRLTSFASSTSATELVVASKGT